MTVSELMDQTTPSRDGRRSLRSGHADRDDRLRRIIDAMTDAVLVVDRDGIVKFANPAAETLFETPRADMVGDPFGFPVANGDPVELDLQGGRVAEMRVVELAWDGEPAWLASLRDMTSRKEAEEAERRLWRERVGREQAERERERLHDLLETQTRMRKELEHAMKRLREEEKRKDQFMAVLGHELRNPLAGIDSGLRLLDGGVSDEKRTWALGMMRKQVSVLTSLLDDLLDVSRIARDKLELRKQPVPLDEIFDAAVAAVRQRFEEREQTIACRLPPEPVVSDVDADRIEQVLTNLLVNASKYSSPGTEIELELRQDGEAAVIEVRDHGFGIEPELLDQVFEPFIQGQRGSPLAGGLGIGLTLVKQIVELHGGAVSAESDGPGHGSLFRVILPVTDEQPRSARRDLLEEERRDVQGLRVLVVDDNEDASRALAELLEMTGCETTTAATGKEALARAREIRPSAVLLDLDLPDLSGYEVAETLRDDPTTDGALLVAVSGFGHEQARERSRESGIDHHLVKPVGVDDLLRLFSAHVAQ